MRGIRPFLSVSMVLVVVGVASALPSAASGDSDWCAGHGLPESKCTKCNPELVPTFVAAGDWCAEHGFPESACPLCGHAPTGSVEGRRIRFRSAEIEQASGIEVTRVRTAASGSEIECTARIEFDRNRLADIRASVSGVVREVRVDLGARVDEGTELFVLESAEVAERQTGLRAARERVEVARLNFERQRELHAQEIASTRQVELAREAMEMAQAELGSIEEGLRIAGAMQDGPAGRFHVLAPISGFVVRRPATIGTFATSEVSLATIADTSRMWALLEVKEQDVGSLRIGHTVSIRIDGLPDRDFPGTVTWIAAEVDRRTRTVDVRAEVANVEHRLRAEQFARATIGVEEARVALLVPRQSVQRLGQESVVFVRLGPGEYEPRIVTLGHTLADSVAVRGALAEGDSVVTTGAFLLKTELSPEGIGAGCCEVDPPGGS